MPGGKPAASRSEREEEKPCSSSSDSSGDVMEEAKRLIGTGNRHLVMRDVASAVGVFQNACGMLAARYGDIANECGEAFFLCGKSLLELARMENGVLGNALEKIPEEPEAEAQPRTSEDVGSVDNVDGEDVEDDQEEDEEDEEEEEEEDDGEDEEDGEDGEENGENKEDEVGNLQLAWEMLEVAKVIYQRREGEDNQLMAAQTYLKLGEVSTESGNYPQALEDFQECLSLQLKHLPPHSRLLAETHYHLASTCCYMGQYSRAVQHYHSSIQVIQARMAVLQEAIEAAGGNDGASKEKKELEELKLLLPDIREKVEDAAESQRTASAASQAIQQTLGGASTSSAFPCENSSASSSAAFPASSQIPVEAQCSSENASSSKTTSHLASSSKTTSHLASSSKTTSHLASSSKTTSHLASSSKTTSHLASSSKTTSHLASSSKTTSHLASSSKTTSHLASSSKTVSDISHLVRKKKAASDGPLNLSDAKKAKCEAADSSSGVQEGTTHKA